MGCVTAACLANLGHRVIGVDRDGHKVQSVLEGKAPFYEPGLEGMIGENVAAGRLFATTIAEEGLRDADIAMICVGTPSQKNGNLGLEQLERMVVEIATVLASRQKPLIIAIRSTVFPGTCEEVVIPALGSVMDRVSVVSNPEFLREGTAVNDFISPSLIVVGGSNRDSVERVAQLYQGLDLAPCLVSLRTAEMIKYACNAFHAVKIAFANEIGALSHTVGIDPHEVMRTLCKDVRLNISTTYLKPGFAFGGSCLPKDLRAVTYRAARLDLKLPLLESTLPSNDRHLDRAIQAVMDLPAKRIGVVGLAFKENTDDLRESPVVNLLEHLLGKGRDVRVFDPHIQLDSIYGSNRHFILNAIPHIGRLLMPDMTSLATWSDYLVLTQKPGRELASRLSETELPLLDLSGSLGFFNSIENAGKSGVLN